ncbi:ZIP Zn transporter [Trypanosoma theileri]|uniref:ZIP Zn transporter n=1 Tax=Trypanosoma theileri TaxID=67003 RepID=A0A1X0NSI7_9TRYP|nr:ZIP Zn transporter [Trypanosoma theileri]ORC87080.1 ZIP Zn transporter [Trypanosoma theileri]
MADITGKCDTLHSRYTALYEEMNNENCPITHPYNRRGLHSCVSSRGAYSVQLHVWAIFVLLFASSLGTTLPLLGKYVPALRMHPFLIVLGKCISTGVVMSVAMVHLLNQGILGFLKDCVPSVLQDSFDAYSLLLAMVSAMLMHLMDVQMDSLVEGWSKRDAGYSPPDEYEQSGLEVERGGRTTQEMTTAPDNSAATLAGCHNHGTVSTARLDSARRIASAVFMEFGLALHSVFLGVSVGIANDSETQALLVALTLHQIFEGLALGSRLAEATMNLCMEIFFIMIYATSVPIGIVIGIGVVKGTNVSMTGSVFVTLQAVFDSVCGGIMLYLGFTLLLSDFPADLRAFTGATAPHRVSKTFAMYAALWIGAGIMTILGKWA